MNDLESAHPGAMQDWIIITIYMSVVIAVALFVVIEYERANRRRTPRT